MAVPNDARVLLALTLIVIFICIITRPSVSGVIGWVTCLGLTLHSMYLMRMKQSPQTNTGTVGSTKSGFTVANTADTDADTDADAETDAVLKSLAANRATAPYLGAIDEEVAADGSSEWPPTSMGDVNLGKVAGTYDRPAAAQDIAGGFYNYGRTGADAVPEPCYDNEANADELDADELNTYQARSRNDAVRVTAGTMNRQRDLDKYLREEVAEAEDRYWWGRQEV